MLPQLLDPGSTATDASAELLCYDLIATVYNWINGSQLSSYLQPDRAAAYSHDDVGPPELPTLMHQ